MTDEELAAIRERAQRATPGPWESQGFDSYPGDEGSAVVGTPGTKGSGLVAYALRSKDRHEDGESGADWYDADQCDDDADFIAHARTDVPKLVAEIELLNTWDGLVSLIDKRYPADVMDGSSKDAGPRIVALVREVARLQGIIDQVRMLATYDGQWPRGLSPQGFPGVVSATAVLAILDGEEQS